LKSIVSVFLCCAALASAQSAPSVDSNVEQRVNKILEQLTLEQKIDMIGGTDGFFIRGFDNPKLPRLKMADGPLGVRNFGPSTAYPAGLALAASWNPKLAEQIGAGIGRDARAKGVNFMLGPGTNIYVAPMNGRNGEYFGEDPYLASRMVVNYIEGMQSQGVSSTIKHFAANNSEYDRHNINAEVDERTLREIYLPAFEAAVKEAHVGAMMDSYNIINGQHATQNGFLNLQVAKSEWKFDGVIMSDWDATYDGVAAANTGLDLEMPSGKFMNRQTLLPAIQQGKVTQATIDDKVRRILRTAIRFGWYDRDQLDPQIPRYSEQDRQVALQGARESIVLLKNDGNLLPLNKQQIKTIAVIGPTAYPTPAAVGGSARVEPFNTVSYLEGISNFLGTNAKVLYDPGIVSEDEFIGRSHFVKDAQGKQPGLKWELYTNNECSGTPTQRGEESWDIRPQAISNSCKRWTGFILPQKTGAYRWYTKSSGSDSYKIFVNDKLVLEQQSREGQVPKATDLQLTAGTAASVRIEYSAVHSWLGSKFVFGVMPVEEVITPGAKRLASMADAAIVFVGYDQNSESEGGDRDFRLPPNQDELIQAIRAANKNTIVVLTAGGNVDMTRWVDQVPALLHGWYLGQESGRAMAEVLFGDVNPSGKLPATFERRWEDNPAHDSYYPNDPAAGPTAVRYKSGIFVGYRGYEKNNVKPLFPFGYGLSYTNFSFSNLSVSPNAPKAGESVTVSFDVTNAGKLMGAEVAQLYLGNPGASVPQPIKELKGFQKLSLNSGETRHVTLQLDQRAMSYFDEKTHNWKQEPGQFTVFVGDSSANTPLKADFKVE
jgi:beta-glucosidase